MPERSYIGIDSNRNHEWIVAIWNGKRLIFSRPFKNTAGELAALVEFILERGPRPRICLKPSGPSDLKLIKSVGGIPGVEMTLMSEAGMRLQQVWLAKSTLRSPDQATVGMSVLLACCAERMI